MKNGFIFAAASFVVLSLTNGCDNEEKMGADIIPASDIAAIKIIDTVTVNAYTEKEKALVSSNQNYLLVGMMEDPVFGQTQTSFAAKFSNTSYGSYKDNAIVDSVILSLGFNLSNPSYGDTITECNIDVYPLEKKIYYDTTYYSDFDISGYLSEKPVGSFKFSPQNAETLIKTKLDVEYGNKILQATRDTTFDENICGLYFLPTEGNSIMRFSYSSSYTGYTVYYHLPDEEDNPRNVSYSIANDDARINLIKHDYSSTTFNNDFFNTETESQYAYLQSLVGTKIRLDFPNLKELNKNNLNGKYYTILRAQLIAPLAENQVSQEESFPAIPSLVCVGSIEGEDNTFYFPEYLKTQNYVTTIVPISIDEKNHQYSINLTARIVDMLKTYSLGSTPKYSVYLYPANPVTDFSRSIINTNKHSDKPMRLVVEYITYEK